MTLNIGILGMLTFFFLITFFDGDFSAIGTKYLVSVLNSLAGERLGGRAGLLLLFILAATLGILIVTLGWIVVIRLTHLLLMQAHFFLFGPPNLGLSRQ